MQDEVVSASLSKNDEAGEMSRRPVFIGEGTLRQRALPSLMPRM
jgi:hypothetical protein